MAYRRGHEAQGLSSILYAKASRVDRLFVYPPLPTLFPTTCAYTSERHLKDWVDTGQAFLRFE